MVTNEKLTDSKEIIAYLATKFPLCFTAEGETKPLKIGIFKDLADRVEEDGVVSRTQLRQALRRYTSSWRYLKCVAKGGNRVDLDGVTLDALEQEHIDHAAKALEESKSRYEKSRKTLKDKKIYKKTHNDTGENANKVAKSTDAEGDAVAAVDGEQANGKAVARKNHQKFNSKGSAKAAPRTDPRKRPAADTSGATGKDAANKEPQPPAKAAELVPLSDAQRCPGTSVLVKFGHSPVPGIIKDVSKVDIHVQLNSGMVIKTKFENLYIV